MFENFLFLIPGKWSFFNDNNNSSLDSFYTEDLWSLLGSIIQNFWDVLLDFTGKLPK